MGLVENVVVRLTFRDNTILDVTASNYLKAFNLLLEMDNSQHNLVGSSSANELQLGLDNASGYFTPTNVNSPYFGLLEDGVKVEVTNGAVKLGTFYVTDWAAPATVSNKTASVRAVDRLQSVLTSPVSGLPIGSNIALSVYLKEVFNSLGVPDEDVLIDPGLTQVLDFAVASGRSVSSVLNDVSLSGNCFIFTNTDNKVVAKSKSISGAPVHIITGKTNLTGVTPFQSMLATGNTLVLGYSSAALGDVREVAKISGFTVQPGVSSVDNYGISGGNLFEVDSVKVLSAENVRLTAMTWTQTGISLIVNNPAAAPVRCDIHVFGRTISLSNSYVERSNELLVSRHGRKGIHLNSALLQTKEAADALVDKLWTLVNAPVSYVVASTINTGFPYTLGDIVFLQTDALHFAFDGYVHSIHYEWRGGDMVKATLGLKAVV